MRIPAIFAAGVLLLAAPGLAQAQMSTWSTDARTGCKIWNLVPQVDETMTWTGACKDGVAAGTGVLQWFEGGRLGDRYEGELVDGKQSGHGVIVSVDGRRYDGNFRDGTMSGHGVYSYPSGERYDGEWRDGKPNGLGRFISPVNGTVEGNWTNGCFKNEKVRLAVGVLPSTCHY